MTATDTDRDTGTRAVTAASNPNVHIFGIRHHGPGSARSVREALERLQPDIILVEGPPDAEPVLPLLAHKDMKPPVALLIYAPDTPHRAVYYPFAVFSPEWQAIAFGLKQNIPVRFMDLPQMYQMAEPEAPAPEATETPSEEADGQAAEGEAESEALAPEQPVWRDPLGALATAAGYSDSERWWEHMVEHRQDSTDLFAAILEAMTGLRDANEEMFTAPAEQLREARREAFMRQTIRAAQKEGYTRIAVICGAWHGPALAHPGSAKEDTALLAGMSKAKVQATWVPWTYGRLAMSSGYGAGIESPGWYHHLWTAKDKLTVRWVARVARLLRDEDLDASPAHIIETVRLAETLAAMRGRPLPGLPELNEATRAVLCFGSDLPMRIIQERLIVGETLGVVPGETPMVPLQRDLEREQKRLRLPMEAAEKVLELDLRKDTDRDRSSLLHRLNLLGVAWGVGERAGGKGTFHENWRLRWQPELSLALIEAGVWGNTIQTATEALARDRADKAPDLPALTTLLDKVILANLPDTVRYLVTRLESQAALSSDVAHLMGALPPLANIVRYGEYSTARQTDTALINHVVNGLVTRICIGLPGACSSLNDDAAKVMFDHIVATNGVINLLENAEYRALWQRTLTQMVGRENLHGLVAGRCCRLLLDSGGMDAAEVKRHMGLALSPAREPAHAAAWVDGFLRGSGQLLLHDPSLWDAFDGWVSTLPSDVFITLLPLLRRTLATFHSPERRQMGERVRNTPLGSGATHTADGLSLTDDEDFDQEHADAILPLLAKLLGVK